MITIRRLPFTCEATDGSTQKFVAYRFTYHAGVVEALKTVPKAHRWYVQEGHTWVLSVVAEGFFVRELARRGISVTHTQWLPPETGAFLEDLERTFPPAGWASVRPWQPWPEDKAWSANENRPGASLINLVFEWIENARSNRPRVEHFGCVKFAVLELRVERLADGLVVVCEPNSVARGMFPKTPSTKSLYGNDVWIVTVSDFQMLRSRSTKVVEFVEDLGVGIQMCLAFKKMGHDARLCTSDDLDRKRESVADGVRRAREFFSELGRREQRRRADETVENIRRTRSADPGPVSTSRRQVAPLPADYAALGVQPGCTFAEAKAAYRRAALKHHPDRGGDASVLALVNVAWERVERSLRAAGDEARA